MLLVIIYLVSVLFNLFVFLPVISKYYDKKQITQHEGQMFLFISLISICIPIVFVVILLTETEFVKNFSLANMLNKLWRIK